MGVVVTEGMLADISVQLSCIDRQSGWKRTLAIGELVLARIFEGDLHAWRSRAPGKLNSLRKLASREDCPFGRSALHHAVGVYVAWQEMSDLNLPETLTPSHVVVVLGLSQDRQRELLEYARASNLSVRELRSAVLHAHRSRRGRPPKRASER